MGRRGRDLLDGLLSLVSWGQMPEHDFLDKSDAELLAEDWKAVGDDLRVAMSDHEGQ